MACACSCLTNHMCAKKTESAAQRAGRWRGASKVCGWMWTMIKSDARRWLLEGMPVRQRAHSAPLPALNIPLPKKIPPATRPQ